MCMALARVHGVDRHAARLGVDAALEPEERQQRDLAARRAAPLVGPARHRQRVRAAVEERPARRGHAARRLLLHHQRMTAHPPSQDPDHAVTDMRARPG